MSVKKRRKNDNENIGEYEYECEYCRCSNELSDELITLTNPKLLSLYDNINDNKDDDHRPQHRISQFVIHDENHVICPFDSGKIENGIQIFMCGNVTPIVEEDDDTNLIDNKNGIATKMIGPIVEWWFSGFDGGSNVIIGVESPYSSYILSHPHSDYANVYTKASERIILTKIVIESVSENPDATYDDLLEVIKERNCKFTEESLMNNSQFIVDQIRSYDTAADDDELILLNAQCIKDLMFISGISNNTTVKDRDTVCHIRPIARFDARRASNSDTLVTSTSLVRQFFDHIFSETIEIDENCEPSFRKTHSDDPIVKERISDKIRINWCGVSVYKDEYARRCYYKSVNINEEMYSIGDFVTFQRNNSSFKYGRIMFMFEGSDKQKKCHLQLFCHGKETILGETSPSLLIFMTIECCDILINCISSKIIVILSNDLNSIAKSTSIYCHKLYFSDSGKFVDLPEEVFESNIKCYGCTYKEKSDAMKTPLLGTLLNTEPNDDEILELYDYVLLNGIKFSVNDCIRVSNSAFEMHFYEYKDNEKNFDETYDDDIYPEKYRKEFTDFIKGSFYDVPNPCHVCRIITIYKNADLNEDIVMLTVKKFYRPQSVISNYHEFLNCDVNKLYYSEDETTINAVHILGKCNVIYCIESSIDFFRNPNTFYFNEQINNDDKTLIIPSEDIKNLFKENDNMIKETDKKLNILDLFSGCGGLAYGFEAMKMSSKLWAIEKDAAAAQSFGTNFPSAIVFEDDANHLLRLALSNVIYNDSGQKIPQKGDVEMILGGPPCQGFSGMNRFSSRQYSLFKNSLVVSYLSYIDYYRPKYLIFENVRNFALFKRSMILKLTLSCLLRMGYQCQFSVLQSGCYGVPQTRRRTVIIGSLSGYSLPQFPQPSHLFSSRQCHLSVIIGDNKYTPKFDFCAAPFRHITVDDAINDLPQLDKDYADDIERAYNNNAKSHYQRILRKDSGNVVKDHVCKELSALCRARIEHIPLNAGSDWRDIPNIRHPLDNGTIVNRLVYKYDDKKNGKSKNGNFRGVCACASGLTCNTNESRQENTLIPWCLIHTANRQYQWSGLYGRISWKGYFPTTVTNPEPISKQGRVLHPQQNRTVSIRESARSQGFSDSFVFSGSIVDRYRQIGNAVPPPLSIAIANEFFNSYN